MNGWVCFFLRVKLLLYIPEALKHNSMPGLLPGWTREDIEQLPNFFFFLRLRVEILNVLYILEALRHNDIMPGLLPGWTRKDIEQLNFLRWIDFLSYGTSNWARDQIKYQRKTLNTRWPQWIDKWARDTLRWWWSAYTLVWQLSINLH